MQSYSAVLLDYDGTLVDSAPGIVFCMHETLACLGLPTVEEAAIRRLIGLPLAESIRRLAPELDDKTVEELRTTYRDCFLERGTHMGDLFPGVRQTLEALAANGVRLAVVSNKAQRPLEQSIELTGLAPFIELAVGTEPGRPAKPDPGLWELALTTLGQPQRALMVGDAEPDLAFARAIGADAAWASWGYGDPEVCLGYRPRHVLGQPEDLISILKQGEQGATPRP